MFLTLLKNYLKSFERPFRKSVTSTIASFFLCVFPFLLVIAGEWIMHTIRGWLIMPDFDFGWLTGWIKWLLEGINLFIENLSLMAMPVLLLLIGAFIAHLYYRRFSIHVMFAIYVFKRATEPLLAVHFAAWLVKWLISHKAFYFLDHLLKDNSLESFGSGQMVIVTLAMWFILALALNLQLSIIRKEKSAEGVLALMEKIRLESLGWIEKHQSNRLKILNKVED